MRSNFLIVLAAAVCGLMVGATPTWAVQSQTWVSAAGTDAGSCPISAPCRTFQYALGQTTANGVINVRSSGDFGPLNITQSVSVVSDGAEGAIYKSGAGAAIVVNGANVEVSLRGLTIDLFGSSDNGIVFKAGKALHVTGCTIRDVANGIVFVPTSGTSELHVSDTVVTRAGSIGMEVAPAAGAGATATFERVRVEYAGNHGLVFNGSTAGVNATVRDSVIAGAQADGIYAFGSATLHEALMLDRTAVVNNHGIGIEAAGGTVRMGNSTITGNIRGLTTANAGMIISYGTNKVNANIIDGAPTSTILYK